MEPLAFIVRQSTPETVRIPNIKISSFLVPFFFGDSAKEYDYTVSEDCDESLDIETPGRHFGIEVPEVLGVRWDKGIVECRTKKIELRSLQGITLRYQIMVADANTLLPPALERLIEERLKKQELDPATRELFKRIERKTRERESQPQIIGWEFEPSLWRAIYKAQAEEALKFSVGSYLGGTFGHSPERPWINANGQQKTGEEMRKNLLDFLNKIEQANSDSRQKIESSQDNPITVRLEKWDLKQARLKPLRDEIRLLAVTGSIRHCFEVQN